MELHVGNADEDVASLEEEVVKVTQERDTGVVKAEQLALKELCVSGFAEEAKT